MNWRRRQTLRAHCPHAVLIDHCSHAFVLPVISAFDGHLFGEGYTFPSVEVYRATFGSFSNMYAQGCLFAGDSETTRCAAETAYAFDLLTGGGQYCSLDWRLWPKKFPYAAGVNRFEPLFIKTYNLTQYNFGLYECGPVVELETTAPGTYAALYHNRVWNESLVVAANMNKTATPCSLVTPDAPIRSIESADAVMVYDVHLRSAAVVAGEQGGNPFENMQLRPQQLRLLHLRKAPQDAVYHQWGGKRISERWDPAARRFSVRLYGPAGLEDWVVLGTGGNTLGQVTVEGRPAEFYVDPDRGLAYGKVIFSREPVLLETVVIPASGIPREGDLLPQSPIPPDELSTEYR